MLFGGAIMLPMAAAHFAGALAARMIAAEQGFVAQTGAWIVISLGIYIVLLQWMDRGLRTMGGLLHGEHAMAWHLLYFAAGTAASLLCIVIASSFGQQPVHTR